MKLSENEVVLHELKPEPKLIYIWLFTKCLLHGLITAFMSGILLWCFVTFYKIEEELSPEDLKFIFPTSIIIFIISTLISVLYHRAVIRTLKYYITNYRCIWVGGILKRIEHTVSYHKITDVERSQNIAERFLSISTINLFTPGTASMRMGAKSQPIPELSFEGLIQSEDQAETINNQIRLSGETKI